MEKIEKKQTFMQGVMALMFSQVIIKILGLAYKLYLTNRDGFGDKGNAIYSSGYHIYAMLLTISSLGVPSAIAKLVSERLAVGDAKGAHRVFKIAFVTFAIIGLVGTLILFFGADYISNAILEIPESKYTLISLSPAIFFVSIAAVFRGYFNGREDMRASANSQSLEQLFKTVITIAMVELIAGLSKTNTLFMAAGANLATTLATFLSFAYIYLYYINRKKVINKEIRLSTNYKAERIKTIIKNIMYVSIPIALTSLMASINKNIDSITVVRNLKNFLPEAEALKQYGILGGKVDTLTALPLALNAGFAVALVPAIASAMAKGEYKTATEKVSFSLLITILLALPCTAGFLVLSGPILNLLFPKASDGATILQITSFTILFTMIAQTVIAVLQGLGKVSLPAVAFGVGVIVKLVLNLILIRIPWVGVNGAAFSSVVAHFVTCAMAWIMLKKYIKLDLHSLNFILKPALATVMMGICAYFTYYNLSVIISEKLATIIAIIVAVIIYSFAILALRVISEENIKMLPHGEKIYKILVKLEIYKRLDNG